MCDRWIKDDLCKMMPMLIKFGGYVHDDVDWVRKINVFWLLVICHKTPRFFKKMINVAAISLMEKNDICQIIHEIIKN